MISFICAVILLILGYLFYGRVVVRLFAPDDRPTPAMRLEDGVDYVPMPTWKVLLIQLLNIAGTGPIFGALSGALFGPVVYLWIVFGCIFAGAVHDYMCGMMSVRHDGASMTEVAGIYLGKNFKSIFCIFLTLLLIMCGTVFTTGPAGLLNLLIPKISLNVWVAVILVYYFIATFVPIDKVIGRLYPVFGFCLIFMCVGIAIALVFSGRYEMPEVWQYMGNQHASGTPIWPFMFITVACGAISGFHATQAPMMARCIKHEKLGGRVFYGAMIIEGIIALTWAAAGVTCYESSQALLEAGAGCSAVVYAICQTTMGKIGCVLAMIGVIVCPISSGDTAFRSARLILADNLKVDQKPIRKRIRLSLPLLVIGALLTRIDYTIVWRYFSWSNQTIAMLMLWCAVIYLMRQNKRATICAVPAAFMTAVSCTYFFAAPECMGLLWKALNIAETVYRPCAVVIGVCTALALFGMYHKKWFAGR